MNFRESSVVVKIFLMGSLLFSVVAFGQTPKYTVACENPNDCPGWVLGLSHPSGVCSAFLVKEDVIATNLHCIPTEIHKKGESCRGKIFFNFPETLRYKAEEVDCDSVIDISPPLSPNTLSTDYAFLKLPFKIQREVLEVDRTGFSDMSLVKIYKVDPVLSSTLPEGIVRKQECKMVQNSILNPYFTSNESPVVMMAQCTVIKGNSGSAIVANDGKAHGIVSSITEIPSAKAEFSKQKTQDMKFAFGTNFSCVSLSFLGFSLDSRKSCQIDISAMAQERFAKQMYDNSIQAANKELEQKVAQASQKFQIAGKPLFYWSIKQDLASDAEKKDGTIAKVSFVPLCLFPGFSGVERYKNRLKNAEVQVPVVMPQFKYLAGHDEFMRFKAEVVDISQSVVATINPSHLSKIKNIPISFAKKNGTRSDFVGKESKSLNLCSEK